MIKNWSGWCILVIGKTSQKLYCEPKKVAVYCQGRSEGFSFGGRGKGHFYLTGFELFTSTILKTIGGTTALLPSWLRFCQHRWKIFMLGGCQLRSATMVSAKAENFEILKYVHCLSKPLTIFSSSITDKLGIHSFVAFTICRISLSLRFFGAQLYLVC